MQTPTPKTLWIVIALFLFTVFFRGKIDAQWRIQAFGTGSTTGHIATLVIVNTGDQPQVLAPQIVYIPADGHTQSYVGRIPRSPLVLPGDTVRVPVSGWCTDVHRPPVGREEAMQPSSWVPVEPLYAEPSEGEAWARLTGVPEGFVEPEPNPNVREVPLTTDSVQIFDRERLRKLLLRMPPIDEPPRDQVERTYESQIYVSWPGSIEPIPRRVEPDEDPETFAPLVAEMVLRVMDAAQKVQSLYRTPFSADPQRELKTLIQQTIWIYMARLTGEPYDKEDFAENVFRQFEQITGRPVSDLPEEEKEELDQGVEAFWNAFEATGLEAKVFTRATPTTGDTSEREGHNADCIRRPVVPIIDNRTGYDLFGDLYRTGRLSFDLNDVRFDYQQKVDAARLMLRSLETVLDARFNALACTSNQTAHRLRPQHFPAFPWDDFFLSIDFCDPANEDKDKLSDYLSPDANLNAVENWYNELGHALDNCGLNDPYGGGTYMSWFQEQIDRALQDIAEAHERFQENMEVAMQLRFNRSRAEARLWQTVVFTVTAAASAGLAAAGGGAAAALASVIIDGSVFLGTQGWEAMGADPQITQAIGALVSLGMGAASAVGSAAAREILEETVVSASSVGTLGAGLDALAQQRVSHFALSLAVLDEGTWNQMKEKLAEDYEQSALDEFEAYRNALIAEVAEAMTRLCRVRNSLRQLLPAMEEAVRKASEYLSSRFWRKLWLEAMDASFECPCCAYSDGRPISGCSVTVPPLGFDPEEEE